MATRADLPVEQQYADAVGAGAVAINVAQYGSATIYQNVVRLSDSQLDIISARLREAPDTKKLPSDRTEACPYPGLETFLTSEAEFFAGRDNAVAELVAAVDQFSISASISASGAGKSSLVNAGLIPALGRRETEKWDIFAFRPGREPLKALSRSISAILERDADHDDRLGVINQRVQSLRTGEVPLRDHLELLRASRVDAAAGRRHQVLFYIDQWEELYTQIDTESDRENLIRELLDVAGRGLAKVLLTMRADFMGELLNGDDDFLCQLKPGICYLQQMTETSLRAAILKPAAAVDLSVPEDLTARLVADTSAQPGALPYLQFVLRQLWEQRERASNSLTTEAYDKVEGLKGAIGRHASSVLEELTPKEQRLAARIIPRLVNVLDSGEPTSRRLSLADFDEDARTLLRKLAGPDKRLIVLGAATDDAADSEIVAEVAHEALLREWSELKGWIADRGAFFRLRNSLEVSAKVWRENNRNPDFLISAGKPLRDAQDLSFNALDDDLSGSLKEYVAQSATNSRRKKIRTFATGIAILAISAFAASALYQSREEWRLQEMTNLAAQAELHLHSSGPEASVELALVKALESWNIVPSERAFSTALSASRFLPIYQVEALDGQRTVAILPDQKRMAVLTNPSNLKIIQIDTGEVSSQIDELGAVAELHALSTDESLLLVHENGKLVVFNILDGRATHSYLPDGEISDIVVNPSGSHVLVAHRSGTLKLVDLAEQIEKNISPAFLDHKEIYPHTSSRVTVSVGALRTSYGRIGLTFDDNGGQFSVADLQGNWAVFDTDNPSDSKATGTLPQFENKGAPDALGTLYSDGFLSPENESLTDGFGGYGFRGVVQLSFSSEGDRLFYSLDSDGYRSWDFGGPDTRAEASLRLATIINLDNGEVLTNEFVERFLSIKIGELDALAFVGSSGNLKYFDPKLGIVSTSRQAPGNSDQPFLFSKDGKRAVYLEERPSSGGLLRVATEYANDTATGNNTEEHWVVLDYGLPVPTRFDLSHLSDDGSLLFAREINAQGIERRIVVDLDSGVAAPLHYFRTLSADGHWFSHGHNTLRVHRNKFLKSFSRDLTSKEQSLKAAIAAARAAIEQDGYSIRHVQIARDFSKLAVTTNEDVVIICNLNSGQRSIVSKYFGRISYFDFVIDGSVLFVGTSNGVRLYDAVSLKELSRTEDSHSYGYPHFSSDSVSFAVLRSGPVDYLAAPAGGVPELNVPSPLQLRPEEQEVAVFSGDLSTRPVLQRRVQGQSGPMALSSEGVFFAYYDVIEGEIEIWDLKAARIVKRLSANLTYRGGIHFNKESNKLFFVQDDGYFDKIVVFDLVLDEIVFEEHVTAGVDTVTLAAASDLFAWSDLRGMVSVADTSEWRTIARFDLGGWGARVWFSENGEFLVAESGDEMRLLPANPEEFITSLCSRFRSLYEKQVKASC